MFRSHRMTISLPPALAEYARREAKIRNVSRSRFIAELLDTQRLRSLDESLEEGYRELAVESMAFAAESLALADELWERPGPER